MKTEHTIRISSLCFALTLAVGLAVMTVTRSWVAMTLLAPFMVVAGLMAFWRARGHREQKASFPTFRQLIEEAEPGRSSWPDPVPARVWLLGDGDEPVGVELARLPEIHGDWITEDLPAALWLIPTGVVVRVGYTAASGAPYVVEGSITGFRGDGRVINDGWWIGGDDITLTGLVILDDPRTPRACAQDRIPSLLPARSADQPGQSNDVAAAGGQRAAVVTVTS
jgi:hypothetical protein